MHFLLVGPGALGCLLSSVISKGLLPDDRLTILDYNSERANLLSHQGIIYECDEKVSTFPVSAISDPVKLAHVDVIFLCVKSYDVENCLNYCRPALSEKTLLIFLQNGISHLDMGNQLGTTPAAFGTTTDGATLLGKGHVRHAGQGTTFLGFLENPTNIETTLLNEAKRVLTDGGMQVETTYNILSRLWAKLFVNTGINALTATLNCKNGELLTLPGAAERMEKAVSEAIQVAKAKDIHIKDDPFIATQMVCSKTAKNVSSMLQDVRNQRRTEIDAINGAIVSLGQRYGIDTPENSLLCAQIEKLEADFKKR